MNFPFLSNRFVFDSFRYGSLRYCRLWTETGKGEAFFEFMPLLLIKATKRKSSREREERDGFLHKPR